MLYLHILLGTPWNPLKYPWGSPDPTLRTNALGGPQSYSRGSAKSVCFFFFFYLTTWTLAWLFWGEPKPKLADLQAHNTALWACRSAIFNQNRPIPNNNEGCSNVVKQSVCYVHCVLCCQWVSKVWFSCPHGSLRGFQMAPYGSGSQTFSCQGPPNRHLLARGPPFQKICQGPP